MSHQIDRVGATSLVDDREREDDGIKNVCGLFHHRKNIRSCAAEQEQTALSGHAAVARTGARVTAKSAAVCSAYFVRQCQKRMVIRGEDRRTLRREPAGHDEWSAVPGCWKVRNANQPRLMRQAQAHGSQQRSDSQGLHHELNGGVERQEHQRKPLLQVGQAHLNPYRGRNDLREGARCRQLSSNKSSSGFRRRERCAAPCTD